MKTVIGLSMEVMRCPASYGPRMVGLQGLHVTMRGKHEEMARGLRPDAPGVA